MLGTELPGSECSSPEMALVVLQDPELTVTQPNPPGTALFEGPVQPGTPESLVKRMVRAVVPDGSNPPVWAMNSQ